MMRPYQHASLKLFGNGRTVVPVIEVVVELARRLWPIKTARNLASRCGVNHRSAEFWLAQRCGMSADALAEIICSDIGFQVLEGIMDAKGVRPSWWADYKVNKEISDLERRQSENNQAIEELRREFTERRAR